MKKIKVIVSGKVQGVGFRMYTRSQARALGIDGYVRNLSNGSVEIVARGEADQIERLLEWAKSGSPSAVVNHLEVQSLFDDGEELEGFEIR